MGVLSPDITSTDIIEAILNESKEYGDYFIVDNGSVWYSRYSGGGAFEPVFSFSLLDNTTTLAINFRTTPYNTQYRYDISNPTSFKQIGDAILNHTKHLQRDRSPWEHQEAGNVIRR